MTIRRPIVVAALALAIALAMGASAANGFVYDDAVAVATNPHVTNPAQWHLIPASTYWIGTLWRPITVAAFAMQWWLFGGQAWGFHLVSLCAYLAVTLLLFKVLCRLGASAPLSLALCVLFAVHPVHVEAVANVVGQSELWTAMALLAATLAFLAVGDRPPALRDVVVLLAVVIAGIMSKEQGFTAPLLLLGVAWFLPATSSARHARGRLLWLVTVVAILMLLIRSTVTRSLGGETPATAFAGAGLVTRLVTFLGVVPRYAYLLTWPMHLQADYSPPQVAIGGAIGVAHVAGALILVAWIAMIWWCRRRVPVMAFGGWWLAVTLAPVSNLVAPTGLVMAERVLFLPSIGFAIALAGGLTALAAAWRASPGRRHALAAIAVAWGAVMLVRSAERVGVWHDQRRFFTQLTADAPRSYRAWKVAAIYWQGEHQPDQAAQAFRRSIDLWPRDPEDYERLGQQLRADGRCAEAIPVFSQGLVYDITRTTLRAKLVECLIRERRWDEAMQVAKEGVRIGQEAFVREEHRITSMHATTVGAGP